MSESGRRQVFGTVTGPFVAYEHEMTPDVLGIALSTVVFFAEDSGFKRNFLGRTGWLDRLCIAIIDYDRKLYVSAYDS